MGEKTNADIAIPATGTDKNLIQVSKKITNGITIKKDMAMNSNLLASANMSENIAMNTASKNGNRATQLSKAAQNNPKTVQKITKGISKVVAEQKKKQDEAKLMIANIDQIIKEMKCPHCPYQLSSRAKSTTKATLKNCDMARNELEDHINAAHERKYCLKCPKCYFSGFWRNTFFEHLTLLHHIFPPVSRSEIGTLSSQQEKDEFLSKFKNTDIRLIASLARIKLNCNICRTDFNNENDLILHKGKPPSFDNFKEILGLVFL